MPHRPSKDLLYLKQREKTPEGKWTVDILKFLKPELARNTGFLGDLYLANLEVFCVDAYGKRLAKNIFVNIRTGLDQASSPNKVFECGLSIETLEDFSIDNGGAFSTQKINLFSDVLSWRTTNQVLADTDLSNTMGVWRSLPFVRPGFAYGHWDNGRSSVMLFGMHPNPTDYLVKGDAGWTDYKIEMDVLNRGIEPTLNPHWVPTDVGGTSIGFRVQEAAESWNNQYYTGYGFYLATRTSSGGGGATVEGGSKLRTRGQGQPVPSDVRRQVRR